MTPKWLIRAGILLWVMALLAGLWLYSRQQLTAFDPAQKLASAASQPGFDTEFVARLNQAGITAKTIVHIEPAKSCYCNALTQIHKQELTAALPDYTVHDMVPRQLGDTGELLAALPALAIIDKDNRLRYLGPYATGFGCLTGNTLIDQITGIVKSPLSPMATVLTDATGCFCTQSGSTG